MVSSRWVAGLSTGMRAFSAIATMTSANIASASETRTRDRRRDQMFGDLGQAGRAGRSAPWSAPRAAWRVRPAWRSSFRATSRCRRNWCRYPCPPGPAAPGRASSATSATTSAAQLNIRPEAKVGTSAAATQVKAKMAIGRRAEEPRGVVRHARFLAHELRSDRGRAG